MSYQLPVVSTTMWLLFLIVPATVRAAETGAEVSRPNVIVIFTDDQGTVDVGCYGASELATPGIDMIAARGVRFSQFYAAAPVCSPSRVGLLTGRFPWVAGLDRNAGGGPSEDIVDLKESEDPRGLPPAEITMAEMFRSAGYATAHIGKWHLGHGPGMRPLDQGFDYSFGHMGGCIDNYSHFMYWSGPNRHDLFENNQRVRMPGKFFPDLMVEKATQFIEGRKEKPFFMYFAMNTPHYPYQGEPEWIEYYQDLPYPRNLYAAFVSTLDARIQRLVESLDRMGLRENTIIVFQSDHGHSTEERAHFGGGENGPYRGAKFSLCEGGIRVPAIISWPGQLPEGEVRNQIAHGCDWLPTVADLCRIEPPQVELSGKSLVGVLRSADTQSPHDALHWKQGKQWAVRQGPWKLIHAPNPPGDGPELRKQDREWFLTNVEENPGETENFAEKHPEIVERLKKLGETAH